MSNIKTTSNFKKYEKLNQLLGDLELNINEITFLNNFIIDNNLDSILYDKNSNTILVKEKILEDDVKFENIKFKIRHE